MAMRSEEPRETPPPQQQHLPLPHAAELRQSDTLPSIPGGADSSVRWRFPPVHAEGHRFGGIALVLTLIAAALGWTTIAWLLAITTVWVFSFFRDPQRSVPQDDRAIIAPADGMVTLIQTVKPPAEITGEGLLPDRTMTRVSIFMSVFDVHINRTPIAGTVKSVVYIRGKFLNADLDKASEDNERQHLLVERRDGVRIGFTQIAGLVARRIVPFVKPGDIVAAGQRIGLIRFGSRVDVYLPEGTAPRVTLGQTTRAGETVIAMLGDAGTVRGVRY